MSPTTAPTPIATAPTPPALVGALIPQLYRGAIRGTASAKRDALLRELDRERALGLPATCFHGFARDLVGAWDPLAAFAVDRGLLALAAWGLDGEVDSDGSRLTGTEKGACMGDVLARPTCTAGLIDAEGRWDGSTGLEDVTDEDDSLALGVALRERAAHALVGDQCWFAMDSHGEVRRSPLPFGKGGVFKGFPVDEFAVAAVNWARFRQAYCNDAGFKSRWGERHAFEQVFAWMDRDWSKIQPALERVGCARPLSITIQAYAWNLRDLVYCLLRYLVRDELTVIAWCDPFPTDDFVRGYRAVRYLQREGFATRGVDPADAVRAYQVAYNRSAQQRVQLDTDGGCGAKTIATMGL